MGAAPTLPELLDWLATELVSSGWRLKHVHRLIVTSATYRQSSAARPDAMAVDAASSLLWRYPPRRLEAEGLIDFLNGSQGSYHSLPAMLPAMDRPLGSMLPSSTKVLSGVTRIPRILTAARVRIRQRVRHLPCDAKRLRERKRAVAAEALAQRAVRDVRHDVVQRDAHVPRVEERQDVRMVQAGGDTDLPQEAIGAEQGGDVRSQHLQGHLAFELQVLGEPDRGHAARTELAVEAVTIGQGRGEALEHCVHGTRTSGSGRFTSQMLACTSRAP
jgi:hypothetical protein